MLITPPPINILTPLIDDWSEEDIPKLNEAERKTKGYRTYMNKKRYAEKIMELGNEYEETGRVIGLDFWGDVVRTRLTEIGDDYDEDKLPGCGLYGSRDFGNGYFTDGLHLDSKGYRILSHGLYESVVSHWPELAPELL